MPLLDPLRRRAALLAVAAGFAVFASALGGMSSVDAELRAVAPLDTTELVRVSDEPPCERDRDESADLDREL